MGNIHRFLLLALVTFHGVYKIVDALACAKDSDCVSTDNVLPKCNTGLCECKAGFYPISTGCGTRLPKPTVSFYQIDSDTREAYDKAEVSLTCKVSIDLDTDGSEKKATFKYVWLENGNILPTDQYYYAFTADINKNNANYSCKVTRQDALASFESDTFHINVISANTAPSGKPRIVANHIALPGTRLELTCTGIPIGSLESDIEFKDGDTILQYSSTSAKANSQFTCQFKGKISSPLEIIKDAFPKPTITARTYKPYYPTFSTEPRITVVKGHNTRLYCEIAHFPGSKYVTTKYYKNGAVISGPSRYSYNVDTSTLGENVYACSAEYTYGDLKLKETKSDTITIVVQDSNPLPEPFIELEPKVGIIGGHVSLKCLTNAIGDLEYRWAKNSKIIYGQSDKTIQLYNVQLTSVEDYYSCIVSNDKQSKSSQQTYAVKLPRPTLSVTGATDPSGLTAGNTFPLVCQLAAAPKGINYRFYKGSQRISASLRSVTKEDDDKYTCATFFNNYELSRSQELVISVGVA